MTSFCDEIFNSSSMAFIKKLSILGPATLSGPIFSKQPSS